MATSAQPSTTQRPSTNPFDPLSDIVGIPRDPTNRLNPAALSERPAASHGQQSRRPMPVRATIDQTADERVAAAKHFVGTNGGAGAASNTHAHSFGVTGANHNTQSYPNQQQVFYQQQQYAMMQMYATYNAMASYNTDSMSANTAANGQQQMQMQGAVVPFGGFGAQPFAVTMKGGGDAGRVAPVMNARTKAHIPKSDFRVQKRKNCDELVSEDDRAFKPLFEEFKASFASK